MWWNTQEEEKPHIRSSSIKSNIDKNIQDLEAIIRDGDGDMEDAKEKLLAEIVKKENVHYYDLDIKLYRVQKAIRAAQAEQLQTNNVPSYALKKLESLEQEILAKIKNLDTNGHLKLNLPDTSKWGKIALILGVVFVIAAWLNPTSSASNNSF